MGPTPPDLLSWDELLLRLGAAAAAGLILGLDRETKRRPMGMRTMMLVCLGCAAATVAGVQIIARLAVADSNPGADALSRVLQGVLGGIGFLGAGTVIRREGGVRGLTTAATVWVTASIGIACGLGEYTLAAIATAIALIVLVILKPVERLLFPEHSKHPTPQHPD